MTDDQLPPSGYLLPEARDLALLAVRLHWVDAHAGLTDRQKEMATIGAVLTCLNGLPLRHLHAVQFRLMDEAKKDMAKRTRGHGRGKRARGRAETDWLVQCFGAADFLRARNPSLTLRDALKTIALVSTELGWPITAERLQQAHYGSFQAEPQMVRDRAQEVAKAIAERRDELRELPGFDRLADLDHAAAWLRITARDHVGLETF